MARDDGYISSCWQTEEDILNDIKNFSEYTQECVFASKPSTLTENYSPPEVIKQEEGEMKKSCLSETDLSAKKTVSIPNEKDLNDKDTRFAAKQKNWKEWSQGKPKFRWQPKKLKYDDSYEKPPSSIQLRLSRNRQNTPNTNQDVQFNYSPGDMRT